MSIFHAERSKFRAIAYAAPLLIAGIFLAWWGSGQRRGVQIRESWKDYATLLVDESVPEAELLAALDSAGFHRVLAASTQPVSISNWSSMETTTLSSALKRLIPGDPRRDGYLETVQAWFQASVDGRPFRVYYVASSSVFFSERSLVSALSPFEGRYRLPDSHSATKFPNQGLRLLGLVLALVILLAGLFVPPFLEKRACPAGPLKRVLVRAFPAIAWLMLASTGPEAALLAGLWILALFDLAPNLDRAFRELSAFEPPRKALAAAWEQLRLSGRPRIALLLCALALPLLAPSYIISFLFCLAASLLLLVGLALHEVFKSIGAISRRAFVPLPIGAARPRHVGGGRLVSGCLACLMIGALALLPFVWSPMPESLGTILYPVSLSIEGPSMPKPGSPPAPMPPQALPGLADWLRHMAWQESIPFMRLGEGRPDPFSPVHIDGEAKAQGLNFDDSWASALYAKLPSLSVEGLLLAQGRASVAVPGVRSQGSAPLAPLRSLLYILLLALPLGRFLSGRLLSRTSFAERILATHRIFQHPASAPLMRGKASH